MIQDPAFLNSTGSAIIGCKNKVSKNNSPLSISLPGLISFIANL